MGFSWTIYPGYPYSVPILPREVWESRDTRINKSVERRSTSKETTYIISTSFATYLCLEEIPKVVVKWGDVDGAILDFSRETRSLRY